MVETINKQFSNGEYKRLSKRIRQNPNDISQDDYKMLQVLRLSYKSPLASVYNAIDKMAHSVDKECICTYRIKRIESIISKLIRFPHMDVQYAADIAGCRCIMATTESANILYKKIEKNIERLPFVIKGAPNNYIENPKPDGYRSIHLNVQMKDNSSKVVEIQIRSLEQHNWATLVEISDMIFHSKLKEYGNKECPELYEFHQILSKQDSLLTMQDYKRITEISGKYRYVEKVGSIFNNNSLELRKERNKLKMNKISYFLISTGSDGKPLLKGFENFDDAETEYFNMFLNNPDNRNIVLTHLNHTSFDKLSIAYSNYFLTYNSTLLRILKAISIVTVNAYNKYSITHFKKYYKAFLYIISIWFGDKMTEALSFMSDINVKKSKRKNNEWKSSIFSSMIDVLQIIQDMQNSFKKNFLYCVIKHQKTKMDKELEQKLKNK
jgi:ppGpp synthetase/RelA/SpoT-type nucleotidyltranferase